MTADNLRARVEQALAIAAAATPGPWVISKESCGGLCKPSGRPLVLYAASAASGWPKIAAKGDDLRLAAAAPDLAALVTDLWAAYTARAQDASVAVARACLERDEARRSLAVAQADLAVARAVDAEHLQRAVRAEQERDAALAELTDFMRTVERRRFARQENARYCADRLSSMDADALRDLVAATASELDDAYAAFDQMAASSIRADLQRAEMRAERDAALATVARHRGEAKTPVVAGGRELVWVGVSDGTWHLCWVDDRRWATAPYSAWRRDAVSYACFGAPRAATVQCNDIRAAVLEAARMARADGHTVSPHPEGWDVGVSNG